MEAKQFIASVNTSDTGVGCSALLQYLSSFNHRVTYATAPINQLSELLSQGHCQRHARKGRTWEGFEFPGHQGHG